MYEPKYDEDGVNLGYLKRIIKRIEEICISKIDKTLIVTTAKTNLNDYTNEGTYYFPVDEKPENIPAGVNGWLAVLKSNDYIKQFWYSHGTANINDSQIYVRTRTDKNTWSNWRRIIIEDDISPTESVLTLNMDYFDTIDNNKVVKSGKVVTVFLRAHTKAAIPNGTTFATLPYTSIINPTIPLYSGGRYSLTEPVFSYLIANTKNWRIATTAADKWLQASFTYITSD